MPAGVRRVGINQIARLNGRQCLPEVGDNKRPVAGGDGLGDAADLVCDFGNVGLGETLRLVAIGNVESPVTIEPHHAVETGTVQKKEIERHRLGIEPLANGVVIRLAACAQFFALFYEKSLGQSWRQIAALNFLIEADNMDIGIGQQCAFGLHVERDNARTAERLDPAINFLRLSESSDFSRQLGFNALTFKRRNKGR